MISLPPGHSRRSTLITRDVRSREPLDQHVLSGPGQLSIIASDHRRARSSLSIVTRSLMPFTVQHFVYIVKNYKQGMQTTSTALGDCMN